ncbi:MAG: DUF4345 domain-containing protein [bacterium]|nr:DUF4345 domain-containing protein [bacterium]
MPDRARLFLLLCGVAFALIGLNTFLNPLGAMAPVGLNINTVSALNELRATYGGMQVGIGLLLLSGFHVPALTRPALLAQLLIVGGLALGRVVSITIDGMPDTFVQGLLVLESIVAVLSLLFFLRQSPLKEFA